MKLFEFLGYFYTLFFVWLTCLTAIFIFRKIRNLSWRWFAAFIILISVLETIGNWIAFQHIKNHFFFNIVFAIEFTILPLFYKYWLHNPAIKKLIKIFLLVFPVLILINTIWIQGFYNSQTYTFVLGGSFVLLLSVTYIRELYSDEETENIFRNPVFWFSIAFLIYFAVSVPFFGMLNYLVENHLKFASMYYLIIIDGTICLYNILLTIGFLCTKAPTK